MKKIFVLIISLLITNSSFALETPMKELSKYSKNSGNKGQVFKKPFVKFFTENLLN
jgi:hypothetical protein